MPVSTALAGSTLRLLAHHQGTRRDDVTAEEPGKILHEVRSAGSSVPTSRRRRRAPLATRLLRHHRRDAPLGAHPARRLAWGLPADEVEALLPALERALAWQVDHGDADGDGLLEYVDRSGHGLSNQGWKDSGDAVRRSDGSRASRRSRWRRCRATPTRPPSAEPTCSRPSAARAPTAGASGRRGCARSSTERFWVEDARRRLPGHRARPRQAAGGLADEQHRAPARHRDPRPGRRRPGRPPSGGSRHDVGLRDPHDVPERGRLLPHRLPRRLRVAARHGHLPGRAAAEQRPRPARGRGPARGAPRVRRPPAGALRRRRALRASRCRCPTRPPAGRRPGRRRPPCRS